MIEPNLPPESTDLSLPVQRTLGVTAARAALLGTWFIASLVIARVLGPTRLGFFALAQAAIQVLTDCISDPLDAAVMREVPLHLRAGQRPNALEIIRAAFYIRGAAGAASLLLGALIPWAISRLIFNSPSYTLLALLTAAGILGDLLLRSTLGYLQVTERFGHFLIVDATWQLTRAAAAFILAGAHLLTPTAAIALYVAAPYAAFFAAMLLLPKDVRTPTPAPRHRLASIMHYSKWLAAGLIMVAIAERLDLFLLSYLRGPAQVGLYAAALTLAMIPDRFSGIIQTAIAPKIAPAHAAGKFRDLQRQYLRFLPAALIATLVALALARPAIHLILGPGYSNSTGPFELLLIGTMFNLAILPLPTALLNFLSPARSTLVAAINLLVVAIAGLTLIPHFAAAGAAAAMLLARLVAGAITLLWIQSLTARPRQASEPA